MSCWSGFWFFVSCHSVMAFPSFTIRWTGAEMLYFHFPRVSNSRWLGEAFSSVLLYEQFTTWSITYSECSSSQSPSQCDRSHINFFSVPQGCTWTHTSPQKYVLSHRHMHTRMQTVTGAQETFGDISRYSAWTCAWLFISFLWENIPYL